MGEVVDWWAKRNETDPRLLAYQQQLLEVSRIRQMMAREHPIGLGRAAPVQQREQARSHETRPLNRDTGMER